MALHSETVGGANPQKCKFLHNVALTLFYTLATRKYINPFVVLIRYMHYNSTNYINNSTYITTIYSYKTVSREANNKLEYKNNHSNQPGETSCWLTDQELKYVCLSAEWRRRSDMLGRMVPETGCSISLLLYANHPAWISKQNCLQHFHIRGINHSSGRLLLCSQQSRFVIGRSAVHYAAESEGSKVRLTARSSAEIWGPIKPTNLQSLTRKGQR